VEGVRGRRHRRGLRPAGGGPAQRFRRLRRACPVFDRARAAGGRSASRGRLSTQSPAARWAIAARSRWPAGAWR
jgi:hypothetical protein